MNNDEQIHVAFAIGDLSDSWNRHAGVAITSLLENSTNPIVLHLLYDKSTSGNYSPDTLMNLSKYSEFTLKYNVLLQYHPIALPCWVLQLPFVQHYTTTALLRLFLPDLMPNLEKIIYLDTDVVVNLDIRDLWDIDISGYYLAARLGNPDGMTRSRYRYYQKIGIDPDIYFNSGVLVLNLDAIRHYGSLSALSLSYLNNHPESGWPDQDALNYLLQTRCLPLNLRYNLLFSPNLTIHDVSAAIIHFAGPNKPWNTWYGGVDELYWEYLLRSPWGVDSRSVFHYVRESHQLDTLNHLSRIVYYLPREMQLWSIKKILCIFGTWFRYRVLDFWYRVLLGVNYLPK